MFEVMAGKNKIIMAVIYEFKLITLCYKLPARVLFWEESIGAAGLNLTFPDRFCTIITTVEPCDVLVNRQYAIT